jgi:DNA-binding protein YbaB
VGQPVDDGLDRAQEWLRNWTASVSGQAAKAQAMSDQVARLSVSLANAEGSVEVTVAGSGNLTNLRLTEAVRRRPPDQIAAEILTTMRRAQATLSARVAEIAAGTVGADSATGRAVVASFAGRFPAETDEPDGGSASDWQRRGR